MLAELRQLVRQKLKLPRETVNDLERFLRRRATIVAAGVAAEYGGINLPPRAGGGAVSAATAC